MSYDPRDYDGENHEQDERKEQERIWLEEQEALEAKEAEDAIDYDLMPRCGGLAEVFGSPYIAAPVEEALASWRKSMQAARRANDAAEREVA